jgi:hypothetical protein
MLLPRAHAAIYHHTVVPPQLWVRSGTVLFPLYPPPPPSNPPLLWVRSGTVLFPLYPPTPPSNPPQLWVRSGKVLVFVLRDVISVATEFIVRSLQ